MSYMGNSPPKIGAYGVESFNGGGTSFTLSKTATTATVLLFIDGVRQTPGDAYSVSGTTLTTTATTPSGTDNVTVQFLGDVVDFGEPSDDSVTSAKIVDGAIVNADINSSAAIALSKLASDPSNASNLASGTVPTARLGSGTADSSVFLRGDQSWAAAGGGLNSVQVFTSSGTWTRPSGVTKVIMEVQGAGGSGSNSPNTEDVQGGAAGGYAKKFLDVSSISTSTITVGAGGSAVTGSTSSVSAGNDGGDSSWADGTNTITANGGDGGVIAHDQPTVGATATGGDINIQGGDGFSRYYGSMPIGGTSMMGFGGMPRMQTRTTVSRPPRGYGSGGGGAHAYSGTAYDSDAGAAGIVIVWEYK